jgi:hypothetical protein
MPTAKRFYNTPLLSAFTFSHCLGAMFSVFVLVPFTALLRFFALHFTCCSRGIPFQAV